MRYYERERREFVRVKTEVAVRYRFLSHDPAFPATEHLDGETFDLSGGGLLLIGDVPDADWIPGLLTERIFLGVEVDISDDAGGPVRALTRAAWVESAPKESHGTSGPSEDPVAGSKPPERCLMGLRFKEITREDLDRIFKFVISGQMG